MVLIVNGRRPRNSVRCSLLVAANRSRSVRVPNLKRGIVIIIHGLNEHSGRYADFAKQLTSCCFGAYAMDWIGHGGSDGLHGYVPSLDHVIADTVERGSLSSLLDSLLSKRLEDHCLDSMEWRPLKNLLLFSQNIFHQQHCNFFSIDGSQGTMTMLLKMHLLK